MTDLLEAVLASADARPGEPAITSGRTLSYGELASRIRTTAAGLRGLGMRPGDRVLFSIRPGADAVVAALAIVLAGGVVVFADPGAGEALFRARTALAAPRWVAAESLLYLASSGPLRPLARRRGLELAPYSTLVPEARHVYAGPWLPGVPRGAIPLRRLVSRNAGTKRAAGGDTPQLETSGAVVPEFLEAEETGDGADALVIFTSGTTGAPKAVLHTRESLGAGLADFAAAVRFRPGQRVLTDQLMVGVPALIAGAHWAMPPVGANPGARPEQYLGLLREAEAMFAVPATLDALLRALDADPGRTPALETLVIGGAPVLRPLLERAVARFPDAEIYAVYGMTEILPVAIVDAREKLALPADAPGDFVGRVVPSVTARIEGGELLLAGAGLARGYLADLPEHPLAELGTGDLARLDGDRLTLLGRSKDMLIRGTVNVYPGLYEPIVAGLSGVSDVALCGVPDPIGDDRIVLALVPAEAPPARADAAHPLAVRVARALPGLIDAGALPDLVVAVPELPRSGRARKLDRTALSALVAPLLERP